MKSSLEKTFKEKIYECNKHQEKILISKQHIAFFIPLSIENYLQLNDIDMSFIDQLIFRFSKLQDTMGEKIFPSILLLSEENVKKMTFIDRLNRLEELEIVNKNDWLILREIRNEIAHEYSFNTAEVVQSINQIYYSSDDLLLIYKNVHDFCQQKFNLSS